MELQKYTYNRRQYYVDYRLQQFRTVTTAPDQLLDILTLN